MNFGIVIFPPKNMQDEANSFRKRFDPHYNLIQPHITIRESDAWAEPMLERAVAHLERAVSELSPFTVRINRFSTFFPVSNVVYMAPENPAPLVRTQQIVCSGVLSVPQRKFSYQPHLTVAQDVGEDEMHDIYASLRPIPLDHSFLVDRVHLLHQESNGVWAPHRIFVFQG